MSDSGEGLVDAEARAQERMDELARERAERRGAGGEPAPERVRERESLRLARAELERQREATCQAARRDMLTQAIAEVDRRLAALAVS